MKFNITLCFFLACPFFLFSQSEILRSADSLAAVGEHKAAITLLENLESKSNGVYLKLAKFQQAQGDNKLALANYKKVLQQNPDRVLTLLDYGELLLENGDLKQADSVFTKLTEEYPDNPAFIYRLGLVREKQKDSTAMVLFFKTVTFGFSHQGALYKTSKYQLENGRKHEAIALAKAGVEKHPKNVSLLSILGQAYISTFQFEKAIPAFKTIIAEGEASEFILEKLAKAYRMTNQLPEALATYEKMLEINDMNSSAHTNMGVVLMDMNKPEAAKKHFYLALFANNPRVDKEFLNLGLAEKELERYEEAYRLFKFALKENEENERALLELALTADRYFEDKQSVLEHYQQYLKTYEADGSNSMVEIAKYRASELKKEIHFSE